MESLAILVVDPDIEFTDLLRADTKTQQIPLEIAGNGKLAQIFIADPQRRYAAIFINPSVRANDFFSVMRSSLQHRPATPLYILFDEQTPQSIRDLDLSRLRVRDTLEKKGLGYRKMVEISVPLILSFDPQEALSRAGRHEDLGTEMSGEDAEFVGISAIDFVSGSKSYFDVYVRLGSGRYVKLLTAGDSFTSERLEGYLKKGVTRFFIRKDSQNSYVSYCDALATAVLKSDKVSVDVKLGQVRNQGDQALDFFKNQGVSEANIRHSFQFVSNVRALVGQLKLEESNSMKAFLANAGAADQAVACTMISAVLANTMEISMDKPVQIVGAASMFQNVGLVHMPDKFWAEDHASMNSQERTQFEQHPTISGQVLRGIRGIDAAAIQAVEQHHQRRESKGFPPRLSLTPVNRVAEIVGISGEFYRIIKKKEMQASLNVLAELERAVFPQFSKQVVYAFRTAFFPRTSGKAVAS